MSKIVGEHFRLDTLQKGAVRSIIARRRAGIAKRDGIDPSTCTMDYDVDQVEFMMAMRDYQITTGRRFPAWSEALRVLKSLGYQKINPRKRQSK